MAPAPHPTTVRNRLLAALPPDVLAQLLPKLDHVELPLGKVIYRPHAEIDAAYFPEAGILSMIAVLQEGAQAEAGMTGRDGMVGYPLLAGIETSFIESMAQLPGSALRMEKHAFQQEVETNAPFRSVLLRHNEAHQAQVMQTAACNANHALEQRLARWLLMAHDRADGDEMPLTQEFMAMMLGVHRPSVTVVARTLQQAGLIRYGGGRVTVLDRAGLEATSCECHGAVRRRYEALMGIPVG